MEVKIEEYKGQPIWIDKNGQFWTQEEDGSKYSYNAGTSLQDIKNDLDFREAYEKATPVKVLRIEFPYLQVWNIRRVKSRRHGFERALWYTKDHSHYGPDHEKYPQEFSIDHDIVKYDEKIYKECERRFKEITEHKDRIREIKSAFSLKAKLKVRR